jgi:hypothetical protein
MSFTAACLTGHGRGEQRAPSDFVPESSRRARGFATWAALRELGRSGVAELVDRCCAVARRFAARAARIDGVEILDDVVPNQVLLRFRNDDAATDAVVAAVGCGMDGGDQLARPEADARVAVRRDDDRGRGRSCGRRRVRSLGHPGRGRPAPTRGPALNDVPARRRPPGRSLEGTSSTR